MYNPNVDLISAKIDFDKYSKPANITGEAYQKINAMQEFKDDLQKQIDETRAKKEAKEKRAAAGGAE